MVEINNQRKAFLDMLAWSEELITDVRKPGKSWYDVIVGRRAILLITPITSQTCHAKPDSNQQAPDAASFFPVGGMPTASSLAERLLSMKSQDAVALQQIKERGALPANLIVVISVGQSTVAALSELHCQALVMVGSSIRLTA